MKRLKEMRIAARMTLETLAERLDVSHATVQRWEVGKRACPSDRIPAIAGILGCHPGELFAPLPAGPKLTATQNEAVSIASNLNASQLRLWMELGRSMAVTPRQTEPGSIPIRRPTLVHGGGNRAAPKSSKRSAIND